eukprot:846958-Pyramimonas_sp.AAC.2
MVTGVVNGFALCNPVTWKTKSRSLKNGAVAGLSLVQSAHDFIEHILGGLLEQGWPQRGQATTRAADGSPDPDDPPTLGTGVCPGSEC